ncbi:MAG: DUF6029 family protein [Candidatus Glassbacteria bacterium]
MSRGWLRAGSIYVAALFLCFLIFGTSSAQSPSYTNVSASNQLEYSLEDGTNLEIVEDWFDFDYDLSPFELGFRYELYQPRENLRINPDTGELLDEIDDASSQGITYRYATYRGDGFAVTLGDFYTMFGRGMTLRLYEDRFIRIDNSMDGLLLEARRWKFRLKALTGRMTSNDPTFFPDIPRTRVDQLHAIDVEADLLDNVTLGTSFLSNRRDNFQREEFAAFRGEVSLGKVDFYGEYGRIPGPGYDGQGVYLATSFSMAGLGLSMEYKNYDSLAFRSSDFTDYNNPPALSREHTYALLNRFPHQLNADNEEGYQLEATWSPDVNTTMLLNTSNTWGKEDEQIFEEYYGEVERYFGNKLRTVASFDYRMESADTHTRNYTPILELEYFIDDVNSVRTELQHQHVKGDTIPLPFTEEGFFWLGEFDHEYVLFEYSRAPKWTFSFVNEWTNKKLPEQKLPGETSDRTRWTFALVSYNITESNNISVMYGSRHGGFNCVGGVCRFEPEFKGLEVKMFTRF